MARRKKTAFSNAHSEIGDVEEYYTDSETSLNTFYRIDLSSSVIPAKFVGYTKAQIDEELKARKETLDRMCSLEVLAAIEAKLRIDYIIRGQNKLKDGLSKKLREIYDTKENRASLVDDILLTWKAQFPEHKERLDDLGKALDYRNWLAHGRYWLPKRTPHIYKYDYLSIYSLAYEILTNMTLQEGS